MYFVITEKRPEVYKVVFPSNYLDCNHASWSGSILKKKKKIQGQNTEDLVGSSPFLPV